MTGAGPRSAAKARKALYASLRDRRGEIEAAIATRIQNDDAPTEAKDPEYAEGLRAAVPAALEYCLAAIERGEAGSAPVPVALLAQARVAARNGVSLDTVLRRYFAGYTLLGDFLVEEAERAGLPRDAELKRVLRTLAASFDRLVAAVSAEHAREAGPRLRSSAEREAQRIERLLAGELLDTSQIPYDLEGHHIGLLATGPGATEAIRRLATELDRRLLLIAPREGELRWAWLGGRRRLDPDELRAALASTLPPDVFLASGEPTEGLAGWRFTHRQARAALPVALRGSDRFVRYADVALLAAVLKDELLATSLRQMYLEPLEGERDGGEVLRETLRAYFAAGRNVSSAAAALDVSRRTIADRLRAVEERVDRSMREGATEIDTALQLYELKSSIPTPPLHSSSDLPQDPAHTGGISATDFTYW